MEATNGVNAVPKAVLELYDTAYAEALADPEFSRFREWSPDISEVTEEHFLHEYVYVVLNAGMKQQVARQVYEAINKLNGTSLGEIRWHGPWRKYTLQPYSETIWHTGCLNEVIEFIDGLMAERRAGAE